VHHNESGHGLWLGPLFNNIVESTIVYKNVQELERCDLAKDCSDMIEEIKEAVQDIEVGHAALAEEVLATA
jgi:hypothetical protein